MSNQELFERLAKAVIDDAVTPMEALFAVELTKAVTGITAHRANELGNQLLEKYENQIPNAPAGKTYPECYDLQTRKPTEVHRRLYDEVKAELSGIGIPFI